MHKKLTYYTIAGVLFVSVLGTLSHFFFEWSGNHRFVGLFSPVSESTWEHIKLLFFPMLLYSAFMTCRLKKQYPCIFSALSVGILAGCLLIPVLFYTYSGILGYNVTAIDIAVFYLSVIAAFLISRQLTLHCNRLEPYSLILKLFLAVLFALFLIFTFRIPEIALFQPPV